jgi:LPXTG-motif cell wall-anchored protein
LFVTGDATVWWWLAAAGVAILVLIGWWIARKGRRFAPGDVFCASRWSAGNRLFPTQVLVTPESVVQYKPKWIGHQEEVIHMAHVASVKIATGMLLSDIEIETSGGSDPIRCHGHHKADATRMKALIEQAQSAYYRNSPTRPIT